MLTVSDKKYLNTTFATKEEFLGVKGELADLKSLVLQVLGELQSMREDSTVSTYRQSEHSDQLDNHEKRLSTVERKLGIAI